MDNQSDREPVIAVVGRTLQSVETYCKLHEPPIQWRASRVLVLLTDDPGAVQSLRGREIDYIYRVPLAGQGRYYLEIMDEIDARRKRYIDDA